MVFTDKQFEISQIPFINYFQKFIIVTNEEGVGFLPVKI